MLVANYSRSYLIDFPKSVDNWFTPFSEGTAGTIFKAGENILKERTYVDKTMRNYRKIVFVTASAVSGLSFNIRGYWEDDGYTEKNLVMGTGDTQVATAELLRWVDSIVPLADVDGMKIGNLDGNTGWIYHDGSKFKNIVRVGNNENSVTWTIKGSDKKIAIPVFPPSAEAPKPYNFESYPYNINTDLTGKTVTTPFPIYVEMPIEALRMDVTGENDVIDTDVVWQYTTQNLI